MTHKYVRTSVFDESVKKLVAAQSLEELKCNGCLKLKLDPSQVTIFISGGFEVDEDEIFQDFRESNIFYFLNPGEIINVPSSSGQSLSTPPDPDMDPDPDIFDSTLVDSSTLITKVESLSPDAILDFIPEIILLDLYEINSLDDAANFKNNTSKVNRFMRWFATTILETLSSSDRHRSGKYDPFCEAFVDKFPLLSDVGTEGGYEFWKIRLIRRCKYYRSFLPNVGYIKLDREKFGRKRKINSLPSLEPVIQSEVIPSTTRKDRVIQSEVIPSPIRKDRFRVIQSEVIQSLLDRKRVYSPSTACDVYEGFFTDLPDGLRNDLDNVKTVEEACLFKSNFTKLNKFMRYVFEESLKSLDPQNPILLGRYNTICRTIIHNFPLLGGEKPFGFEFWKTNLINRLKRHRQKLDNVGPVKQMREKYGRKCLISSTTPETEVINHNSEETNEFLRKLFPSSEAIKNYDEALITTLPDRDTDKIIKNMKDSFTERIFTCLNTTTQEKCTLYPDLKLPCVILQEFLLLLPESRFVNLTIWQDELPAVLIKLNSLQNSLSNYKQFHTYINNFSEDKVTKLKNGFLLAIIAMRDYVPNLFNENQRIHISAENGCWTGIVVDDVTIECSGVGETIACFIAAFVVFQIEHSFEQEATCQLLEYMLGIRTFDEITRSGVRSFAQKSIPDYKVHS